MKRPLLLTAILFCFSIIVYRYFGLDCFICTLILSFSAVCVFVRRIGFIIISAIILISSFFAIKNVQNKTEVSKKFSQEKYNLEFTVVSDEINSENAKYVTVKTNSDCGNLSNMKFNVYYKNNTLICGQKINAKVCFFKFDLDKNRYYLTKGIYGNLWLINDYKTLGYNKFYKSLGNIRKFVKNNLNKYLSNNSAKTLTAIMLGDKSVLDDDFSLYIKKSGVSHIMAVSGLHLSVILGFLFLIFSRLLRNMYLRFCFSVFSVFAVVGVCGFTPSVLRAGLMFIIISFALILKRDTDVLTVISFAALVLLLFSPMLLFNISFQMSVLAIISVIYITPFYYSLIENKLPDNKYLKAFILALLLSIFATVFTMPVAIYNFKYISLSSVITNIFISLPTTFAIYLSMSGLIFCFIPFISRIIMKIADLVAVYLNFAIEFFGKPKYSAICVPQYFCIIPIIAMVVLLLIKIIIERRSQNGNN